MLRKWTAVPRISAQSFVETFISCMIARVLLIRTLFVISATQICCGVYGSKLLKTIRFLLRNWFYIFESTQLCSRKRDASHGHQFSIRRIWRNRVPAKTSRTSLSENTGRSYACSRRRWTSGNMSNCPITLSSCDHMYQCESIVVVYLRVSKIWLVRTIGFLSCHNCIWRNQQLHYCLF